MRMTISVPDEIAKSFCKKVPKRKRSQLISQFMEKESKRRESILEKACLKANRSKFLEKEIDEWQSLRENIEE